MNEMIFLELVQKCLMLIVELSMPVLSATLFLGLGIGLFQAVTQIQEATLTFVPKIVATLFILVALGPWMLKIFIDFTTNLYSNIPTYI